MLWENYIQLWLTSKLERLTENKVFNKHRERGKEGETEVETGEGGTGRDDERETHRASKTDGAKSPSTFLYFCFSVHYGH